MGAARPVCGVGPARCAGDVPAAARDECAFAGRPERGRVVAMGHAFGARAHDGGGPGAAHAETRRAAYGADRTHSGRVSMLQSRRSLLLMAATWPASRAAAGRKE